jgi:hypothetical protein
MNNLIGYDPDDSFFDEPDQGPPPPPPTIEERVTKLYTESPLFRRVCEGYIPAQSFLFTDNQG